jgi:hypothetical protein
MAPLFLSFALAISDAGPRAIIHLLTFFLDFSPSLDARYRPVEHYVNFCVNKKISEFPGLKIIS